MKQALKKLLVAGCVLLLGTSVMAKLPTPSDEAKAKAAEAAAKTAWSGKVDAYLLCKSQDKVVAHTKKSKVAEKDAKAAGKDAKSPATASACVDPGAFVYVPVVAGAASAPAAASSAPAATPAKKP